MVNELLICVDGNSGLATALSESLQIAQASLELRHFPDGETYINCLSDCSGRDVIMLGSLNDPNAKTTEWILIAETLRDLGANSVGLVAPYLAYMRQDIRFQPGEGISSRYYARLLSRYFDWLITVDPHLHRYNCLSEIYNIPARVLHASSLIGNWVAEHIEKPLLIGPDSESEQWVAASAAMMKCPYIILDKVRRGDRDVKISVPDVSHYRQHTPILVDDIISTGQTLIETTRLLRQAGLSAPVAIAVHGLFAQGAESELKTAGLERIITCDSIVHSSNCISLAPLLTTAIRPFFDKADPEKTVIESMGSGDDLEEAAN